MDENLHVKLVETIVKSIIEYDIGVEVKCTEAGNISVIQVKVPQSETGKIIGKEGKTVNAIRHLLSKVKCEDRKKWMLSINE